MARSVHWKLSSFSFIQHPNVHSSWIHVPVNPLRCCVWHHARPPLVMSREYCQNVATFTLTNLPVRVCWVCPVLFLVSNLCSTSPHPAILPRSCRDLAGKDYGRPKEWQASVLGRCLCFPCGTSNCAVSTSLDRQLRCSTSRHWTWSVLAQLLHR